jgi:hypothetical protein
MSELAQGLSESTNSPAVEASPTLDSVFDSAVAELSTETPQPESTPQATDSAGAPTTQVQPPEAQTPEQPQETTEPVGPIPLERHKAALENARTKERESVFQQVQQELEPIKPMLPLAQAIAQDVQNGSIDGLNNLLAEYAQHPVLGAQLRSMLGRALSKMRGAQPPQQTDPEPEADLQTADGALVYSAQQLAKREAWLTRQWQKQMEQQLAPFKQFTEKAQKAEEFQQQQQQAQQRASRWLEHWSKQPHFTEHKAEIAKAQAEFFQQGHDTQTALGLAYAKVVQEVVLPKLQSQSQQSLVQQAGQKLAASAHNPAASAPSQPRKPKSVDEAFDMAMAEVGWR